MKLVILFTVLFFIFLSFFGNTQSSIDNPFLAYTFFILEIILEYFPYFLIGFCIIFLFLIRPFLSRKHLTFKIIRHTFFQIITIFLTGFLFSFFILVLIGLVELNIYSGILNKNPGALGVKTQISDIVLAIKDNDQPPTIITSDKGSESEVKAIAKASSGTNNFYGNKILSAIPDLLIIPVNTKSNLLFLDNTLIVKSVNEDDMKILSPLIGYQIIKSYFPTRFIKSNPQVTVLNRNSYNNFRDNDAKNKLTKVEIEINKTDAAISSLSADIEKGRADIILSSTSKKSVLKDRDNEYNKCLSEGTYKLNVFTPKNTQEFCEEINKKWEEKFKESENQEKNLTQNLADNEKLLKEYKFYNSYFKAQKQLIDFSTNNIPSELGVFEPPASIKVIINDSSSTSIADFFEYLCHEYLHFTSFNSDKRLESTFFEEGLTEYFARNTIKTSLKTETNLGYPLLVKVIEELSKKISEPELAEIYFNKDQQGLEDKINLIYGEDFYKKNIVLFETLVFTQDPKEALKITNTIMEKLGGRPIDEQEVFSKRSEI